MIKDYVAEEGILEALKMVKRRTIIENMPKLISGKITNSYERFLSYKLHNTDHNGTPAYLNNQDIQELQSALSSLSSKLMNIQITPEPVTEDECPMCYGDSYIDKLKVLRQYILLPYIFEGLMGKTTNWSRMRLSRKTDPGYGKFKEDEIEQINNGIRTIAINLASIKLLNKE